LNGQKVFPLSEWAPLAERRICGGAVALVKFARSATLISETREG
jgi:hypothetical protein